MADSFQLDRVRRPDGRQVLYYRWADGSRPAAPPAGEPAAGAPAFSGERRWNAPLGEWVLFATRRQDRTFLPPADACPLCPTEPGGLPTELARSDFEIAVFENRFPALVPTPPPPSEQGTELSPTAPSAGVCEVVVYSPDHATSLGELPLEAVRHLVDVWAHRTAELSARPEVAHVFPFENRGEVIGVTLEHPHGQIYAYPMVPPIIARELAASAHHGGACLWCELLADEEADGRRIVDRDAGWVAGVPFAARWPYEMHLTPQRHVASLLDLADGERHGLAALLRRTVRRYDRLFGFRMPYVLAVHQAPTEVPAETPFHLHLELYPAYRSADRLKYLAGSELGAGVFLVDALPEETAAALRALDPS